MQAPPAAPAAPQASSSSDAGDGASSDAGSSGGGSEQQQQQQPEPQPPPSPSQQQQQQQLWRRQVTFPDDDAIAVVHHLQPSSSGTGDAPSTKAGDGAGPQQREARCADDSGGDSGGGARAAGSSGSGATQHPSCWRRLMTAVKQLKAEVLALYYAVQDPRTPLLCKLLPWLVLGYALSPVDLIPDFIPVLGYLDDLVLLPLGLWLSCRLIPAEVMRDSRALAAAQPLRLSRNWLVACVVVGAWTGCLLWGAHWLIRAHGSRQLQQYEWAVLGGGALLAAIVFAAWAVQQRARDRRRWQQQPDTLVVEPLLAVAVDHG